MIMSCSYASSSSFSSPALSTWADLPNDILEMLVRSMHSPFDRLRFGAVCRSWMEVAAAVKRKPGAGRRGVAPLPIMTFRDPADGARGGGAVESREEAVDDDDDAGGATPVTRCFYSMSEDKIYRLRVPSESRDWRCFGCSRGWLGMVDFGLNTFLFDPISGARVDLPSLTTLTRLFKTVETIEREVLRDRFIHRLALSSSPLDDPNCVVMTTFSRYRLPAYARPGDDTWVQVPDLRDDCWHFGDIIYHDRGVFYALAGEEETISISFGQSKSPPSVEVVVPAPTYYPHHSRSYYLVALPSGDLLRVTRFRDEYRLFSDFEETDLFQLHKLEADKRGAAALWVEVQDIGECCLFLGAACSMSLPASEVLGKYRANSIFFTDDHRFYRGRDHEGLDHGIYDIGEAKVEHFCHIDARRVFPQPMWITPRF